MADKHPPPWSDGGSWYDKADGEMRSRIMDAGGVFVMALPSEMVPTVLRTVNCETEARDVILELRAASQRTVEYFMYYQNAAGWDNWQTHDMARTARDRAARWLETHDEKERNGNTIRTDG